MRTDQSSAVALLLVDIINNFESPDGDRILKNALPVVERLARLMERARKAGIPTVYVNDNFGQWRSNFTKLVEHCIRNGAPGRRLVVGT